MLLLLACSPKAEVWVTPDATVVVSANGAAWTTQALSAGGAGAVAYPASGQHTMRIAAPSRAAVVGVFDVQPDDTGTGFNHLFLSDTTDALRTRHPSAYLRVHDGPFPLPAPGQGLVLTVDVNTVARATLDCGGGPETFTLDQASNLVLGTVAETDPWVHPLAPGACTLAVAADGRESATTRLVVTAGEYVWLNAQLARATEHYGSGWMR
jgi:hypothetical protein